MTDPEPEPPICANCRARLVGPWCHSCGQRDHDVRRAIWEVMGDALSESLELDARLPRTAAAFVSRPGFLVEEFVAGRRRSWTSPVRILVFAVFVSFLVFGWASDRAVERMAAVAGDAPVTVEQGTMTVRLPGGEGDDGNVVTISGVDDPGAPFSGAVARLSGRPNREAAALVIQGWLSVLPFVVALVLVPLFGLLLEVAFPRFLVIQHLLLSMHVHALGLVAVALAALTGLAAASAAALVLTILYLGLAMRRIYPQAPWRIASKLAGVAVAHAFLFAVAAIGSLVLVLASM